jgi:beta-glucosidase
VKWAKDNLPGILVAWYPGQQGGNAVADVLFGDANPAGRLPVTFYKSVAQLPPFADYNMDGRTYRYFKGEPVYPFGFGLSYTKFSYSGLRLSRATAAAGDRLEAECVVKNAGSRAGDEVVQLYVRDVESARPGAIRSLRGFQRIQLAPGEATRVRFALVPARDFASYDETRRAYAVEPGAFDVEIGSSSADIRLRGRLTVR